MGSRFQGRMNPGRVWPFLSVLLSAAFLAGCLADDVDLDEPEIGDPEPPLPELEASSGVMSMQLRWEGPDTVDLVFSSDPGCDWDNYSLCEDGGRLTGQSGGERELGAVVDEFDSDTGWYFVAESEGGRSQPVAARPLPIALDGVHGIEAIKEPPVNALERGESLYVGGSFSRVGPLTGGGAMLDRQEGRLRGVVAHVEGEVKATVSDGEGGFFIGGEFEAVGGEERINLARIRSDGAVDRDWQADADAPVHALARMGEQLLVGGEFTEIVHDELDPSGAHIAVLEADSGAVDPDWGPDLNDRVLALKADDERVYAGGDFTEVNGASRDYLIALDGTTGSLEEDWEPELDNTVFALATRGERVFVGGAFQAVDDEHSTSLAALDAETGEMDSAWDVELFGEAVRALAIAENRLHVGGAFGTINDESGYNNFAVLDLDSASVMDAFVATGIAGTISDLAVADGRVYMSGNFAEAVGGRRDNLVAFDADTGELSDEWNPGANRELGNGAIALSDNAIYVGGNTTEISGESRQGLVALDPETGLIDDDWQASVKPGVMDMALKDGILYVAGDITEANGEPADHLVAFDANTGERDSDWSPEADDAATSLLVTEDVVFAGGAFSRINDDEQHQGLVALDAFSGAPLVNWDAGEISGATAVASVRSMASSGDSLFIGGNFQSVDDTARDHIAALDLTDGSLEEDWDPGTDGMVNALVIEDGRLHAGGSFTGAGGGSVTFAGSPQHEDRAHMAAFDPEDGSLDETWVPSSDGVVMDLVSNEGQFYAVGGFSEVNEGTERERIARFGSESGALDLDWDPALPGADLFFSPLRVVLVTSEQIFVGGEIPLAGGDSGSDSGHQLRGNLVSIDPETGDLVW